MAAGILAQEWSAALRRGCGPAAADLDVRVAYYADDLRSEQPMSVDDPEQLAPDVAALVVAWATGLGMPTAMAQGRATVPLRAAVDWVAAANGLDSSVVDLLVARFFPEVAAYFGAARGAARDRVVEAIRTHRPSVVIAHSLGSVVAYEALCANPDLQLDTLVTVGSPLGMPHVVYHRLNPVGHRPAVRKWHNIADRGDLIAIPRAGLAGLFDVDSDPRINLGPITFHAVTGYLMSAAVAAAVRG